MKIIRAAAIGCAVLCATPALAAKPNILWITFDDLSPRQLQITPTPAIDAIARTGITYTQAHASATVCRPSRAGMHTGIHQQRFGIYKNPPEDDRTPATDPDPLPSSAVTIAEELRRVGYRTALFGKWHLGYSQATSPQRQGFQSGAWYLGGGHPYYQGPLLGPHGTVRFTGNLTEWLGIQAAGYIRKNRNRPWFVDLQLPAPHEPLQSDPGQMSGCGALTGPKRTMCGMIRGGDRAVASVMAALRSTGQLGRTLVVITADNGCASGGVCDDGGLRGTKGQVWEGGARVPLIVSLPGRLQGGTRRAEPVSLLDLMPTSLALAGVKPQRRQDGVSLLTRKAARPLYFATAPGRVAMIQWPWKLYNEEGRWQLYNLSSDGNETRDVAGGNPAVVQWMAAGAMRWNAALPPSLH